MTERRSKRSPRPAGITLDPLPVVATILDRWSKYARDMKVCDCRECRALRARPYQCKVCGYSGTPLVYPCSCPADRREHARWLTDEIVKAEAAEAALAACSAEATGLHDPYEDGNEDDEGTGDLAFLENEKRAKAEAAQSAKADAEAEKLIKSLPYMRRVLIEHLITPADALCSTARPECCHGSIECPVCVDGETRGWHDADAIDPWGMIRDLRAALNAARAV